MDFSRYADVSGAVDVLRCLVAGNTRFATSQTINAHESADWRQQLVGGQHPIATVLGCSDSRVPIELVFDQGLGDLFVIRVAGNVVAPEVVGSLAYAIFHLKTPVVVVLGHEGCGAVGAALQEVDPAAPEPPDLVELLQLIKPGLAAAELPAGPPEARLHAAVEANVRWSVGQLARLPGGQRALQAKRVALVGAVYDLATGQVRYLDDP